MKKGYKTSELIREYLSVIIISIGLTGYGICAKSCAEHKETGLEKKVENTESRGESIRPFYKFDEEAIIQHYLNR